MQPWRGHPAAGPITSLLGEYSANFGDADTDVIERAYAWAASAHRAQRRKSGEPFVEHPLNVARIVARLGLDDVSVAAALLHDVIEDTDRTLADVDADFGPEVAKIVDGVTKLDRVEFTTRERHQAASLRKMLVAMAKDLRVLIIKLADRLHNMCTLAALSPEKQQQVARETLDVYAPLAHRLGMQELKGRLEDLAFAALHPKWYAQIDHLVAEEDPERDLYLAQLLVTVEGRLLELGIGAEVTGRPKHLWSIYEKMVLKNRDFNDIYDLVGIRVITESVRDCYAVLGAIHAIWKPLQGRFKDYIAMPKFNLYQSLHTAVVGPQGKVVEVQIRTREMHARAEHGVAAHWDYKEDSGDDLAWLSRIIDWSEESDDPEQFLGNLKVEFEQDEVFVFTPRGDVVTLPVGATPVDFAYAIHTEVGHGCIGARINGRLVALTTKLSTGDTVEVMTSKDPDAGPSQDWLQFVATSRARSRIRQWLTRERRTEALNRGRDEITTELRRESLPIAPVIRSETLRDVAKALNYDDTDALFVAVGERHLSARTVTERVARRLRGEDAEGSQPAERVSATAVTPRRSSPKRSGGAGVHVEGLGDVWVRLAKCCTPVVPDEIIGFVTRGRGVSIHRADCANAVALSGDGEAARIIDVEWEEGASTVFTAAIEVRSLDRPHLLRDVAVAVSEQQVNITSVNARAGADGASIMRFEMELSDGAQLSSVLHAVRRVGSVYDAYRVLPGGGRG
ncbi:MAG: bifunctional (p)ppGpp synthetase/guanosine-3',5'-bis(diphosphate) 3'-pyrophosphohydrolase [Acidimicrobiia bacterium]|nr:bifunctional (p)ppGpp synthetase/guanosine-3',5'-bis(diphosphate) 3'-pyrophosphohydrolase [Acidimicrobiia bacterium]